MDGSTEEETPRHRAALERRFSTDSLRLFLSNWRGSVGGLAVITLAVIYEGHGHIQAGALAAWGALLCLNTLAQAGICATLERDGEAHFERAMDRWTGWLVINIGLNGVLWGSIPLLLTQLPHDGSASSSLVIGSALLNAMLLYCINSTPGLRSMHLAAAGPIAVLGMAGLETTSLPPFYGIGYLLLIGLVIFYGIRLSDLAKEGAFSRYRSEVLADRLVREQAKVIRLERERTLLEERERLTHEMHDGLGSALVTSLAAIEQGDMRHDSVSGMLRECVDELRTVIDSLEPVDGDVLSILATIRHRMEPRIQAAGIHLDWQINDLPALAWLGPGDALHVMRIVQEALTNVVKHARATGIVMTTRHRSGEIEICLADNGVGFAGEGRAGGRGISIMRKRAVALGGRLALEPNRPAGSRVLLFLPIAAPSNERRSGPAASSRAWAPKVHGQQMLPADAPPA